MTSKTTTSTILIAGCGDIGSLLGEKLVAQGHKVIGLRRNINQLPQGIQGISADLRQLSDLKTKLANIPAPFIVVYALAASERSEAGYRAAYVEGVSNLLAALPASPEQLLFTSSTSVYHQNDHSWVDEGSPCLPESMSGQVMLEAEQQVLNSPCPSTVVRFSGIYGPGREYLLRRVAEGHYAPDSPILYSNRIHREDCAGVLQHLIELKLAGETLESCYLASDDEPSPINEVTDWLAKALDVKQEYPSINRSTGSKRCSNQRLLNSGYRFRYNSFKTGYQEQTLKKIQT